MENKLKPETSSEILWALFSLMTLEPSRQVAIMGGLPHESNSSESDLTENGAAYFLTAVQTLHVSWLDEFEPCPIAQQLFDLVWTMDYRQSYESFMKDENWKRLRELATAALDEAGMVRWPVPKSLNFSDFIEIVRPDVPR